MKNVTVSQSCRKWYVSIQTEYETALPQHSSVSMDGLDTGISKLAKLQRDRIYKLKFSHNWKKAKQKVQKQYPTIANIRHDHPQKTRHDPHRGFKGF